MIGELVCSAKIEIIMYLYMTPSPGYRKLSVCLIRRRMFRDACTIRLRH